MKCVYVLAVFVINLVVCTSFSIHANYNSSQLNISNETSSITDSGPTRKYIKHRRFIPFARPSTRDGPDNLTDTCSSSADDFPDFLTTTKLKHGGVILCFLVGIYCFTLLAIVCNRYFLPCVETICEVLNLSPDVAAATFMSVATSCPELFTNFIGTFITESDIGIGTIVGSSLFNALGVAAIGGLASITPLELDWWPVTRDVILYVVAVSLLVMITWDEYVHWYEALILFVVYFLYFTVMFQNTRISNWVKGKISRNKVVNLQGKENTTTVSVISAYGAYLEESNKPGLDQQHEKALKKLDEEQKEETERSLFRMPEGTFYQKVFFFCSWPLQFVLRYTVPNPKFYPKLFPVTFVLCIIWIGINAYIISWMMSLIGSVFAIPDSVLGLTFLAAGGSLPESISMVIISRRGEGAFGVSNALGANTMNILLSLGMPWFFKTISKGANSHSAIKIQSGSIEYTILALIAVAFTLFIVLYLKKFRLGKLTGGILLCIYLSCVVLAILSEMVFFDNSVCTN